MTRPFRHLQAADEIENHSVAEIHARIMEIYNSERRQFLAVYVGQKICRELVAHAKEIEYDQYDETVIDLQMTFTRRDVEAILESFVE